MAKKPRPRLHDDATKGKAVEAKLTNTERERIGKLVDARYQLHKRFNKDTASELLEESKLCVETFELLDREKGGGAVGKFLSKLGQTRAWLTRMRHIGECAHFDTLEEEEIDKLPPHITHLDLLTKVRDTSWEDILPKLRPDITRIEISAAIKGHVPKSNRGPRLKPEDKRDKLVLALTELLTAHPDLADGVKDTLDDFFASLG